MKQRFDAEWRPTQKQVEQIMQTCVGKIKAAKDPNSIYPKVAKRCRDCIYWPDAIKGQPRDHVCLHNILTNNESQCKTYRSMSDAHGWEDVQTGESARAKKRRLEREREQKESGTK